jgi:hypothetical protein
VTQRKITATVTPTGRTITDMGPFWNRRDKAIVYHTYYVRYNVGALTTPDSFETIKALDDDDAREIVRKEVLRRNAQEAEHERLQARQFEVRL